MLLDDAPVLGQGWVATDPLLPELLEPLDVGVLVELLVEPDVVLEVVAAVAIAMPNPRDRPAAPVATPTTSRGRFKMLVIGSPSVLSRITGG